LGLATIAFCLAVLLSILRHRSRPPTKGEFEKGVDSIQTHDTEESDRVIQSLKECIKEEVSRIDHPPELTRLKSICESRGKSIEQALRELERGSQLDRGLAALARKNYQEAAMLFRENAESFGQEAAESWFYLGNSLFFTQDYKGAIQAYERSTQINPVLAAAWSNWGVVLTDMKRFDEAVEKYQRATQINPDLAVVWYNLGVVLAGLKRFDDAIEKYQRAIQINPHYAIAWSNWGVVLTDIKRFDEAIEKYQRAVQINPELAEVWYNWGVSLAKLRRFDEAVKKYQMAIEINPEYAQAWSNWGATLADMKMFDESVEKYQRAININPHLVQAWSGLIHSLEASGRGEEAQDARRQAKAAGVDLE